MLVVMDLQQRIEAGVRDKLAQIIAGTFGHEYTHSRIVANQIMGRFDLTDKQT